MVITLCLWCSCGMPKKKKTDSLKSAMRSSRTDSRGNLGFTAPSVRTPKICPEALGMESIQSAPHRTSSLITRQTHYFTTDRGHQHGFISQFPQLSNLCLSLTQFAVPFEFSLESKGGCKKRTEFITNQSRDHDNTQKKHEA